jgi:hypothetical protein
MSLKKPSHEEDEYFAREDAERRHALAVEKSRRLAEAEREHLRVLHYMHCPKCGFDLEAVQFRGVTIDKCFHCNGSWLDVGEFELLAGKEHGFLSQVVALFRSRK